MSTSSDHLAALDVHQRPWGSFETVVGGRHGAGPPGAVHRLGNPGRAPARVLEIAFGDFDEDDIERLEDDDSR